MTTAVLVDMPSWFDTLITWLTVAGIVFVGGVLLVFLGMLAGLGLVTAWDKVKGRFGA